jgi:hypothetical protein
VTFKIEQPKQSIQNIPAQMSPKYPEIIGGKEFPALLEKSLNNPKEVSDIPLVGKVYDVDIKITQGTELPYARFIKKEDDTYTYGVYSKAG